MNNNIKIESIAGGRDHTIAVDIDGKIYTWGANSYGQLGLGITNDRFSPTLISLNNNIKIESIAGG